jgi:poly(A) polymerase
MKHKAKKFIMPLANINPHAVQILQRLTTAGFEAFLVGGCVRDLLLNLKPKDFDIATNAEPEQVKALFRNCILIGRRFRLAHVRFGREIIEVATFRRATEERHVETGMILRDNIYGSIEEDAWRRDFTINALYYNIKDSSIVDYTNGIQDLKNKIVRMIGDPMKRYHEDPVRMLRALRLAGKVNFVIEKETERPISELANLLKNVSKVRLFDEIIKWFKCGNSLAVYKLSLHHGLFQIMFPYTKNTNLVRQSFFNTDKRLAMGKSFNPAFLFSVLLWGTLQRELQHHKLQFAMQKVLQQQNQHVSIPRRFLLMIKEIWTLQYWLTQRKPKKAYRTLNHIRFRAAYDFLLLRVETGEKLKNLADWWTKFQEADDKTRKNMLQRT